jgi:hypothetical protein
LPPRSSFYREGFRDLANSRTKSIGPCYPASVMEAKGLTPILNVSDIASTVAWFEKWGWKKLWDWGTPPTFGAVGSGKEACIFLCQGAQGGRGRGANTTTFQQDGDEEGDKGVWMSVWVDDVDEMHRQCVAAGLSAADPFVCRYLIVTPRKASARRYSQPSSSPPRLWKCERFEFADRPQ